MTPFYIRNIYLVVLELQVFFSPNFFSGAQPFIIQRRVSAATNVDFIPHMFAYKV